MPTISSVEQLDLDRTVGTAGLTQTLQFIDERGAGFEDVVLSVSICFRDADQNSRETRHVVTILGWKVGAAIKRNCLGREKHSHRPAAVMRHHLNGVHVDLIEIRPLFTIDFDVHEIFIHQLRDLFVFKRLVRHHVTPVTRRVADAEQDWLVFTSRSFKCFFAPRIPIDRIVRMLQADKDWFR